VPAHIVVNDRARSGQLGMQRGALLDYLIIVAARYSTTPALSCCSEPNPEPPPFSSAARRLRTCAISAYITSTFDHVRRPIGSGGSVLMVSR
jgi:hypothetical protein